MPRTRTLLAAATLCGVTLLPSVASADPVVHGWSDSGPVADGATGALGQTLSFSGIGCDHPVPGERAYMGIFTSGHDDPRESPYTEISNETQVDEDGGYSWSVTIPVDNGVGRFYARWYCSPDPATSISDPDLLWVSPLWTFEIREAAGDGIALAGESRVVAPGASPDSAIDVRVDPDGLPAIDRMGIHGEVAAELKARVDARAEDVATVHRLSMAYRGFGPTADELELVLGSGATPTEMAVALADTPEFAARYGDMDDVRFVAAVYQRVLGRPSDAAGRRFWAAQLAAGNVTRGRLVQAFADTPEGRARTEDAGYVVAAHLVLGGRVPGRAALQPSIDRLAAGEVKVAVVEEIALRYKGANRWNSGR